MRLDARKLLEKLNRKEFSYREFEDIFSETELWPIFEAVLADQRIVGDDVVSLPQKRKAQQPEDILVPAEPKRKAAPAPANVKQIFAGYGASSSSDDVKTDGVDLQNFFSRFSEMD